MSTQIHSQHRPRHIFRGEQALCIIAVLNSFAVYLMLYSGAGISSISSVPYVISEVLPIWSLGTWTYERHRPSLPGVGGKEPFRCAASCQWACILEAGTACLPAVFFRAMNL